jgi:hypothetical protein
MALVANSFTLSGETMIEMTKLETARWNNDDQAVALLSDLHWARFFDEPKRTTRGSQPTRVVTGYLNGLRILGHAAKYLQREHGPKH